MSNRQEPSARPYGQGSWFISLGAAFVVAVSVYKDPYKLPVPDAVIDGAKSLIADFQKPKDYQTCLMTALAHSPTGGCNLEKK